MHDPTSCIAFISHRAKIKAACLSLFRDKNCFIFKHLSASKGCRDKCGISCLRFSMIPALILNLK